MKKLTLEDADTTILALQAEIQRSQEARYDHRLHGILLIAHGMSAREVSRVLGDSPRTVAYWVHRFEAEGVAGLTEGARPGRPGTLSDPQLAEIDVVLRKMPSECALFGTLWDGNTLSAFIRQQWGITLGVRQCQRIFRQLNFRLRKPRPVIAKADLHAQATVKKTLEDGAQ